MCFRNFLPTGRCTPLHLKFVFIFNFCFSFPPTQVYYSLRDWGAEQWSVHPSTGVVSLTRPLLLSEQTTHELTVVARDRGVHAHASSQGSQARVRVKVERVNLHAPEIHVRPLPEIIEHAHGDIYAIVRVTDR